MIILRATSEGTGRSAEVELGLILRLLGKRRIARERVRPGLGSRGCCRGTSAGGGEKILLFGSCDRRGNGFDTGIKEGPALIRLEVWRKEVYKFWFGVEESCR